MTLFARPLALERPDEIAIRDPNTALTWSEVDVVLNQCANGLLSSDLGNDHRIAVFAENSIETAVANLGGLIGGASVVPVNFHLNADEVNYILNDSDARILFVGPETVERGIEAAFNSNIHTVIAWNVQDNDSITHWQQWLAAQSEEEPDGSVRPRPNLL